MKSIKVLSVFILLSSCFCAMAQNTDDSISYSEYVSQRNKEFTEWRQKANSEFSEYLKNSWNEFLVQSGRKDPIGAVPDKPTYYEAKDEKPQSLHGYPSTVYDYSPVIPPSMTISASYIAAETMIDIDFFGVQKSIPFDNAMRLNHVGANEKDVANGWAQMSSTSYMSTVDALSDICSELSLCDWARYITVKKISEALYSEEDINERVLTQMFLLCQMKYKVRIGSAANKLILLLPFKESVYQVSYVSDNGEDFYLFSYDKLTSETPIYSFQEDFSFADSKISLAVGKSMNLGLNYYKKISVPLWSSIFGEEIVVPVNEPFVSMSLEYPQTDLLTYHQSAVDRETGRSIFRAVKYKILKDGMNQEEAVAFILNLIQKGFEYKTDYEMFGRPKPLFIEESFFYGSNNCKDRVLIFSWLVQNTLDLKTVLLRYPGHVACGVEFLNQVDGDSFQFGGHTYVMCDPTYIGAPIGATMPQFKNTSPTFVEL